MYTSISKRVKSEDVLTIVESYFMPYGIACDQYSVMGDILSVEEVYNQLTGEKLYQMQIECNDMSDRSVHECRRSIGRAGRRKKIPRQYLAAGASGLCINRWKIIS